MSRLQYARHTLILQSYDRATIYEDLCRSATATFGPNANIVWSHYFDSRDNTGSKVGYSGFLSNILQQIGSHRDSIHPALQNLFFSCQKGLGHTRPSNWELENALAIIINELNTGCIVLDAMDECSMKDSAHVSNWLMQLQKKIWIVVTSRNFPEGRLVNIELRIALDSVQPSISRDIKAYLNMQMEMFSVFGDLQEFIMETLAEKAQDSKYSF